MVGHVYGNSEDYIYCYHRLRTLIETVMSNEMVTQTSTIISSNPKQAVPGEFPEDGVLFSAGGFTILTSSKKKRAVSVSMYPTI